MISLIKREYDYALRIVAYLAGLKEKNSRTITQISKTLFISKHIATKAVYQLIQKGILQSQRGRYGGVSFIQDVTTISVYDVLQAVGYDSTINLCLYESDICPLSVSCKIQNYFRDLEHILIDEFKKTKIAELLFTENKLKEIQNNT